MKAGFVLGVIASEGSFQAKMAKTGANAGYTFTPAFEIHMNRREEGLLRSIAETLPAECTFHERNNSITLYIGGRDGLRKIIEWINEQDSEMFDLTPKASSMKTLEKIIDKLDEGLHSTPEGTVEIARLRNEMNPAGSDSRVEISEVRNTVEG